MQYLIKRFYTHLAGIVEQLQPESILDAGCGEGESIARLSPLLPVGVVGCDINLRTVQFAAQRCPQDHFSVGDLYHLPYPSNYFDLVLCLEVLEHLEHPQEALCQLWRVTKKDLILSVPHEPFFWLGNFFRGKYWSTFGNHPEHLRHWSQHQFQQFLLPHIGPVKVDHSFPWLLAHRHKGSAAKILS